MGPGGGTVVQGGGQYPAAAKAAKYGKTNQLKNAGLKKKETLNVAFYWMSLLHHKTM